MGGNLKIGNLYPSPIILDSVEQRSNVVFHISNLLIKINALFYQHFQTHVWDTKNLKKYMSGSTHHLFNDTISINDLIKFKSSFGDIDVHVPIALREKFLEILHTVDGYLGSKPGRSQTSSLWNTPIGVIQVDFEYVNFCNNDPTAWSKFSHSSSFLDITHGIKGVFHKMLFRALTSLSFQNITYIKQDKEITVEDTVYSFAVTSLTGGGLRKKYIEECGKIVENKDVYITNLSEIFKTIIPGYKKENESKYWSFLQTIDCLKDTLSITEKEIVVSSFVDKIYGKKSQTLYRNNKVKDCYEKFQALNVLLTQFNIALTTQQTQIISAYNAINACYATQKRKSIMHLKHATSKNVISNKNFDLLTKDVVNENFTLRLKTDGVGLRIGKDENGYLFMLTSRVTEPKYIFNVGCFEMHAIEHNKDVARAKHYDNLLKLLLSSNLFDNIPKNCIVSCEALFNDMATESKDMLTFVHIPYERSKLGKILTLIVYNAQCISTNKIYTYNELNISSSNKIKIISNEINCTIQDREAIISACKEKCKDQLYNVLTHILNNISFLGNFNEGVIISTPNTCAKVTSTMMQETLSEKKAVVAIGSFAGHLGHCELIDNAILESSNNNAELFVFVGNKFGKEDPIPVDVKLRTLNKLYPQITFSPVTNQIVDGKEISGNIFKKIEYELVKSGYNNVTIMAGEDKKELYEKVVNQMNTRFSNYEQTKNSKVYLKSTKRNTGISFTKLRNVLHEEDLSFEEKFEFWRNAYSSKLDNDWVYLLMYNCTENMK